MPLDIVVFSLVGRCDCDCTSIVHFHWNGGFQLFQLLTHKELNKSFKFVCNVVSHCLSKLLEIKIYNSYEQLDVIKTELLGNSIEIEIKIEIIQSRRRAITQPSFVLFCQSVPFGDLERLYS